MTDEAMTDEQTRVLKFALRRLISQGYALMDDAAQHGDEHKNRGSIDAIQKDIETAEECLKFFEPETEDIETQHIKGLAKVLRDHADSFMPGAVHEALTAGADALEEKLTRKPLDEELEDLYKWCRTLVESFETEGQVERAYYWEKRAIAVNDAKATARKWIDATED